MDRHQRIAFFCVAVFLFASTNSATARTWSDPSGKYTIEADLIGFSEKFVILQRSDNQMASVRIDRLSREDQKYLQSEEAKIASDAFSNKQQTWHTRDGVTIIGNVVDYIVRDVTVQRRRGKVYVNDRVIDNLPKVYQVIVPKIVAHFEKNSIKDKKSLEAWLSHKRGNPFTYRCEGVVIALENGDEYAIPFFLLKEEDLEILQPGWEDWLQANEDPNTKQQASYELQALAAARQQDAEVSHRIGRLQLGLQAVQSGVTSLWEVTLYPGRGVNGPPQWVVAPGRDSRAATAYALNQHPGYVAGPVRRVSN